jgi:hypothetical protein
METEQILHRCSLFPTSSTAIKHMIERTGGLMEERREDIERLVRESESLPQGCDTIVASLDGTNVQLAEPGAKRGRPKEQPKGAAGQGQQHSSWRNAMVGAISFYDSRRRTPQNRPERLSSIYMASMPEERCPRVKHSLETELKHILAQAPPGLNKIALMDGARSLWTYCAGTELYNDFTFVVDFFHATQHLSRAAEALFGKSSSKAHAWYRKWCERLKWQADGPVALLRSMEYYRDRTRLSTSRAQQLAAEVTFFRRNKAMMPYARMLSAGLPIGSGPIESACKNIVKQRLCRSGMRWTRTGGQRILNLRTYVKSGRWSKAWKSYLELRKAA